MKNTIKTPLEAVLETLIKGYETSSWITAEYIAAICVLKREFSKYLTGVGAADIKIDSAKNQSHFGFSGFFTIAGRLMFFTVDDLRSAKFDTMLVRNTDEKYNPVGPEADLPLDLGTAVFNAEFIALMAEVSRDSAILT